MLLLLLLLLCTLNILIVSLPVISINHNTPNLVIANIPKLLSCNFFIFECNVIYESVVNIIPFVLLLLPFMLLFLLLLLLFVFVLVNVYINASNVFPTNRYLIILLLLVINTITGYS